MQRRSLLALAALITLAGSSSGQIPPGWGVRSLRSWFGVGSGGVELVDVYGSPSVTPLSGVSGIQKSHYTVTLDPVTGELVVGRNDGSVRSYVVQGTAIAAEETFVILPDQEGPSGIDFDRNGNYFVVASSTVYRMDRATKQLAVWDTSDAYPGDFNQIAIDPERRKMWIPTWDAGIGARSVLLEYDLTAGPGPGTVLLDSDTSAMPHELYGIDDDGEGTLYIAGGFHDSEGEILYRYETATAQLTPMDFGPLNNEFGDSVWVDRVTGDLHFTSNHNQNAYYLVDPVTFAGTVVVPHASVGVPSGIAVNDFFDRTEVFPRETPTSQPYLLEVAAHAGAGELAAIAVTRVNGVPIAPVILLMAPADGAGVLGLSVPIAANALPVGTSFTLQTARVEAGSGVLVVGSEATVTHVP